jgi:hypothetical protein
MSGYWYLGSPYSKYPGGIDEAFARVVEARGLLVRAGVPCFSPIIHCHMVAKLCGIDPHDHSVWLPAERPMLNTAMGLIVLQLEGWEESYGLTQERLLFQKSGRHIIMMEPGTVPAEFV